MTDESNPNLFDLKYVISKMPGYIYWKDAKSRYMGCNDNLAKYSHLRSPEDIVGMTDYDFEWGKEQADQFVQDDQRIMKTGTIEITEYELPQQHDNKSMVVRTDKMPFYDKNGNAIGILAIAYDITEQKELEKSLREEKEKTEVVQRLKDEFMRNVEHDLRTPFNGILGMSDILMQQEEDPEKKECLADIVNSAKTLLNYCNEILEFSRYESGISPILHKKFHLKNIINDTINAIKPAAKSKGLAIDIDYDHGIPEILIGDKTRISRILLNLVSNSIKFTDHGKISILITEISRKGKNILLSISVKDTGIGIPNDKINIIFDKFTRLTQSNQGQYTGTGLGLRIVKSFMEDLNGEIEVESDNSGTIFTCLLPLHIPLIECHHQLDHE